MPMDLPVLLFPRCTVAERDLRRGIAFFDSLEICQPWFLGAPAISEKLSRFVRFHRPPAGLKPKEDLKGLLSEYLAWVRQHQDRDVAAFLRASPEAAPFEGTKWEIRQRIRRMDGPPSTPDHALKWHMILHLSEVIEKNRREAEEIVLQLKRIRSPLKEALGETVEIQGLFDDLPVEVAVPPADPRQYRQILDAWIHLFGSNLKNSKALLTFDSQINSYLSEIYNEMMVQEGGRPPTMIGITLPDLSSLPEEVFLQVRQDEALLRVVEELKALTGGVENPRRSADRLSTLSSDLEKTHMGPFPVKVRLSVTHLPSPPCLQQTPGDSVINGFAGKTLLLLEGMRLHDQTRCK